MNITRWIEEIYWTFDEENRKQFLKELSFIVDDDQNDLMGFLSDVERRAWVHEARGWLHKQELNEGS